MPKTALSWPQLHLFPGDSPTYLDALARYEVLRPILQGQRSLLQQSHITGLPYKRLWRDLQRFRRDGLYGLLDHRTLPHRRGKMPIEAQVPAHIQQQIVRLALAHPFTARELARIVQTCHAIAVDHRGIRRVLDLHHLPTDALRLHYETLQQAHLPPFPAGQQLPLALEPSTHAQRLAQALGPDHLLLRFRTYREYPTEEQARWRIIELLEVGFRPRRVAQLWAIQPAVVYYWHRRFAASGLVGLTTRPRQGTAITTRASVQALMEVFQLLDNHPLVGHYRVKMALDSLGYRYGHTTVWRMVALQREVHPRAQKAARLPSPGERPQQATVPHQVWFVDVRYLVQIDGQWLYRILIFDGYSRAIVGAGGFERQHLSRLLQVFRQALTRWGAPCPVVSDHAAVFTALAPCLRQLGIQWSPITRGRPWQNLAEGGCSLQRRMLDAYVVGCTEHERVYHQHAPFVRDYQFWGHWAQKRRDTEGRVYDLSPEVVLGQATGQAIDPTLLRRVFRLRQLTRTVRRHGQIRLHHFGLYVERDLWGHTVEVAVYDDMVRTEQATQQVVSYPCVYDTRQRRITAVEATGRQQYLEVPVVQLVLFTLALVRTVWCMPHYHRRRESRHALSVPQMSLLPPFAGSIVHIRIGDWRIYQTTTMKGSGYEAARLCYASTEYVSAGFFHPNL